MASSTSESITDFVKIRIVWIQVSTLNSLLWTFFTTLDTLKLYICASWFGLEDLMRLFSARHIVGSARTRTTVAFLFTQVLTVVIGLMLTPLANRRTLHIALLVAMICTFVFGFLLLLKALVDMWRVRYIAFVSAGTRGVAYYEAFFEYLVQEAADHSNGRFFRYVVFPWRAEEGRAKVQLGALRGINHSGIIVVPTSDIDVEADLASHDVPFVLIRPHYTEKNEFEKVEADEISGGRLAAEAAIRHLQQTFNADASKSPVIWILIGRYGDSAVESRNQAFEEVVRNVYPRAFIKRSPEELRYQRERTRIHIYDSLMDIERSQNNENGKNTGSPLPHVIFAANDDMALGAREAFRQFDEESGGNGLKRVGFKDAYPQVIGFDGTEEMKDLLRTDDERYLLATIDIDIESHAKNAWHSLLRSIEKLEEKEYSSFTRLIERNWSSYTA